MSDAVQDLGQQLLAAAWDATRILDDPKAQAERFGDLLEWVTETEAQLAGLRMRLIHEAHLAGAETVIDQVRISTRTTTQRAGAEIRLAKHLAESYPLINQAVCDGVISLDQAEAMVTGLRKLPARLTRSELERCQTMLIGEAEVLGPHELRALAFRMLELLDPETAEEAEAAVLARQERRARATRSLRLSPDFHGSMRISGRLPIADGALLQAQIQALMPPASSYSAEAETPSVDARQADALVLLTQIAASSGQLPEHGLDRPTVHITLNLDALASGLGRIGLLGGNDQHGLTAGEARRLACDANLIPVVLGGASQPLDVGRTHRLVPKPLRMALIHRDGGCAFPHCATTAPSCEAHHIQPWWDGGETSLANTVLLCPHHHRLVEPDPLQSEQSQWQARINTTTGLPEFIPPRHIDPARVPRQHRRHKLLDMKLRPGNQGDPPSEASPQNGADQTLGRVRRPAEEPEMIPRRGFPPQLDPKDDPWHPDYEPPAKVPPPRRQTVDNPWCAA